MKIFICKQCGKEFSRRTKNDRVEKYCSHPCYSLSKKGKPSWNAGTKGMMKPNSGSFKKGQVAPNQGRKTFNHSWNFQGFTISSTGYKHIFQPHHHRANKKGYVPEHTLVAEKFLKRFLIKGEVVHHINSNKLDNAPENLYLFPSTSSHSCYHKTPKPLISNII